ncbi:MAG: nucleotidyltransferase domain-containing protein [Chloroflexota bacterium]
MGATLTTRTKSWKPGTRARTTVLARLAGELKRNYRCHTVILYGSRARGDHSPASDYDLVGICQSGPVRHVARRLGRAYVDAFVYPEGKAKPAELLRIRGGRVLFQKRRFGETLLHRIDRLHARGPKALSPDEMTLRRHWAQKMLDRARRADAEGHFRRVWLLNALLEDYFALRGMWYEGPKVSLRWLRDNEPEIAALFAKGLRPGARLSQVAKLAVAVTAVAA